MLVLIPALIVCSLLLLAGCTGKETVSATNGIENNAVTPTINAESSNANSNNLKIQESISRLNEIGSEMQTQVSNQQQELSPYNVFRSKEECSTFMNINDKYIGLEREIHMNMTTEYQNLALLLGESSECLNAIKLNDNASLKFSTDSRNSYNTFASYCNSSDDVKREQATILSNSLKSSEDEYSPSYDNMLAICPKLAEKLG